MTIETVLVMSTSHISQKEATQLQCEIEYGSVNAMMRPEGFMIPTNYPIENFAHISMLIGFAKSRKCQWLLLDRDGKSYPELLETFEW